MMSICDVVLNHTANETAWLAEHPEASYNCLNCPHLRPAALLDVVLARLAADLAPRRLSQLDHLEVLPLLLLLSPLIILFNRDGTCRTD